MSKGPLSKLIAFYVALFFITVGVIELMSLVVYWTAFRESFSYHNLQASRLGLLNPPRERPNPGRQLGFWVIHPYYGFVTNPAIGQGVNDYGFFGQEEQIQPDGREKLVVAVIGGSVAAQLAFNQYAGDALKSELKKIPAFRQKEIIILDLGNGAFKQPQGLFVVNDIISRGGHIDLLIALDGFNEIALPEAHGNVKDGISPFYPQSWRQIVDTKLSRDQMEALAMSRIMADARVWLAFIFAKPVLRHSVTTNLIWQVADAQLVRLEAAYRRAQDEPRGDANSRLSNDNRAFLGPESEYTTRRELYKDVAVNWGRAAILLNNALVDQGGIFMQFIQPNQYVAGSKPLTEHEEKIAINVKSPYKSPVEIGYPYLRAVGQNLSAAGIWFEDLTEIYAKATQELYIDDCCHVNKEGYEILAKAVASALAIRMSNPAGHRNRPVAMSEVNLGATLFASGELRKYAANSADYHDGSEEPIQRARQTLPPGRGLYHVQPAAWRGLGTGFYETQGTTVTVQGPNQVFTVAECLAIQCKVHFSIDVLHADAANIGTLFLGNRGELISQASQAISGVKGEARVELVAPLSTKKVRAFVYTPGGVVEFRNAVLVMEPVESAPIDVGAARSAQPAAGLVESDTWKVFGKASYEIRGDEVFMRGPDHIFSEADCPAPKCDVQFSIAVEHTTEASIGLYFLNEQGTIVSEKVQVISGTKGNAVIQSVTPELTKKVRAFVYAPRDEDRVEFKQPVLLVKPVE